jgi:ABC-2 type transport system ATP-binding protein
VFLNSHLLSELEMVCDRVAILVQGVVSSQGTIEELTRHSRRYEIEVVPGDERGAGEAVAAAVAPLPLGVPLSVSGSIVNFGTDDPVVIQPVIDALRARGLAIRAVRQLRASLEDLFMQAVTDPDTGRTIAPGAASAARGEAGNAARQGLGIGTGVRA